MQKTELTFTNNGVDDFLEAIGVVESIMNDCDLIKKDMKITRQNVKDVYFSRYEGAEYYIAIRKQGVEDASTLNKVVERCQVLGEPHITIKLVLKKIAGDIWRWNVTINRK